MKTLNQQDIQAMSMNRNFVKLVPKAGFCDKNRSIGLGRGKWQSACQKATGSIHSMMNEIRRQMIAINKNGFLLSGRLFLKPVVILLFLLLSVQASAVVERYGMTTVKLSSLIVGGNLPTPKPSFANYDNKAIVSLPFSGYTTSPYVLNTDFKFKYIRNQVKVSVDRGANKNISISKNIRVKLQITTQDKFGVTSSPINVDLDIKFNPALRSIEDEVAIYQFENAVVVNVSVVGITDFSNTSITGSFGISYPEINLDAQIEMDRVYNFNPTTSASTTFKNTVQPLPPMYGGGIGQPSCLTDGYDIQWSNITGAEAWELEWSFLEDDYNPSTNTATLDFKTSSSRVRIDGFSTPAPLFRIPGVYEMGLLVFRVRPIGRDMNTYEEIYGDWSMADITYNFNVLSPGIPNVYPTSNYNLDLNWNRSVEFAEGAKSKNTVTYFDGLLRDRQVLTMNNTANLPIVGQTIYDFSGRPAVQVLPAPALDGNPKLCFRPKFNRNLSNQEYNFRNFDLSANSGCPGPLKVDQMSNSSGASKYYSTSGYTAGMDLFQAYVPDAGGYPFTQIEYTPDNTGRVSRQSALGPVHRLSGVDQSLNTINGKEQKYLYGKPYQEQLDMMFGAEAGNAEHFKRNVIIDQNGQASVSYIDPYGKVVATSLAGDPAKAPSLAALPSSSQYYDFKVTSFVNSSKGISKIIEHTLIVTDASTHSFEYTVDARAFSPECTPAGICYDCVYDMELSLVDECGINLIPGAKQKVMVGNIMPFDLTCNAVSFSLAPGSTLDLLLQPGRYTLRKELKINLDAMKFYQQQMWNNNTCLKTLDEFVDEEKLAMNIKSCVYTCSECNSDLDAMNTRKTELTNKGSGRTEAETQELNQLTIDIGNQQKLCNELCSAATPCDALLESILADVRPGGQYAPTLDYNETTGVLSADLDDPYSVLNESNLLLSGCSTRNWRYPMNPNIGGSTTNDYYNEDGTLSLIPEYNGYPEIKAGKSYCNSNGTVFSGNGAAIRYIKPQDLKNQEDFIKYYSGNPSWAQSLKYYHPEYCYYAKCKNVEATYEYNNRLLAEEDPSEALKKGYFNPVDNPDVLYNTSGSQNPYTSQEVAAMRDKEPLFSSPLNTGDFAASGLSWFRNHLYDYVSTPSIHRSIWELYNEMQSSAALDPGDVACAGDQFWPYFRALYITAKDDILRDYYLSTSNCSGSIQCPGCSGNTCAGAISIPSGKLRRFPLDASSMNGDPLNVSSGDVDDNASGKDFVKDEVTSYCEDKCESYKDYWSRQLSACGLYNALTSTQKTALLDDLKSVCVGGCDTRNLLGSRSVAPYRLVDWPSGDPTDFNEVLGKYLGPGAWLSAGVCDEMVLEWPLDYGHDYSAYEGPYADTCACNKKNYAKTNPNCSGSNVPEPLDDCACNIKNPEVRQSVLRNKIIPDELKCQNCVDCRSLNIAYASFVTRYGSAVVSAMSDAVFETLLERWVNLKLGFNLTYADYLDFAGKCKNMVVAPTRTVWNDYTQIRWVEKNTLKMESVNVSDSLETYLASAKIKYRLPEKEPNVKPSLGSSQDQIFFASDREGISEVESTQSADADKLACHCEKLLTARWYKDNDNANGLSDVDMMKKVFGSSIYTNQAEFDKNYNVCCNAFKMNVPPVPNCSESGFKPGDKFSISQKAYFDNHVLSPNTNPVFVNGGVSDFAKMYDNNCNNPLTSDNKRELIDNCACDKIMAAKNAYEAAYSVKYNAAILPPGVPTFETYMYNLYNVSGADFKSLYEYCQRDWESGVTENSSGQFSPWPGIGANWPKVAKQNLGQDAIDDGLYVPKGLLCSPQNPVPVPCKGFIPNCYMLQFVLKEFLDQNALPPGLTLGNPYAPGDPDYSTYNFYKAWEFFYQAYMDNTYSGSPDPALTAFFEAFASFANAHALIKAPCPDNASYSAAQLIQSFKSCLPQPCKPSCDDFSKLFSGFLAEQALLFDLPAGLATSATMKEFFDGAKTNYYTDPVWNALVDNFISKANHLIKLRCPSTNRDVSYDFTQVWHMMWYCFNWPKPEGVSETPPAKAPCTACFTVNYDYLEAFRTFLNQICRGPNAQFGYSALNRLRYVDWFLQTPGANSFQSSVLYTGTSSSTLKYLIDENTFGEPFMDVKVTDANGFKFGFTLEYPSNEDIYNYGYIKEFVSIKPKGRFNCGLPKAYEMVVDIIVPKNYINAGEVKTITMGGTFTYGGYATWSNCLDTCVRLCNKPMLPKPELDQDPCEKTLLRIAYSNALMKYEQYKQEINKAFEENYIAHCLGVGENFSMQMTQKEYHYTLFYYDQAGNLIKSVPPEGVDFTYSSLTGSQRNLFIKERLDYTKSYRAGVVSNPAMAKPKIYHTMVTHYKYNTLNQLVWKRSPDEGDQLAWYDALGRSVVSRNSKQAAANKYNYSLFDALGRVIESGEKTTTSSMSYAIAASTSSLSSFMASGTNKQVSTVVYDDYTPADPVNAVFLKTRSFLRHRVAANFYYENTPPVSPSYPGQSCDAATHYSYDIHGNVSESVQYLPILEGLDQQYKHIYSEYDLISSKINRVHYQTGKPDQMHYLYTYDADNRLVTTESSRDGWNYVLDVKNFYYLHGGLARRELGSTDQKVQGLDYALNINGWMKSLNGPSLTVAYDMGRDGNYSIPGNINKNVARDAIAYVLRYHANDYSPSGGSSFNLMPTFASSTMTSTMYDLYDGNISHVQLSLPAQYDYCSSGLFSNGTLGHNYRYDQLNRLVDHKVFNNFSASTNYWPNNGLTGTGIYYESFTYDAVGNIESVIRNGNLTSSLQMDNLTYRYGNVSDVNNRINMYSDVTNTLRATVYPKRNNRLYHVDDNVANATYSNDFDDQGTFSSVYTTLNTANNFGYDEMGNLIKDNKEEIAAVEWNSAGKIRKITRTATSTKPDLEYVYDASGFRMYKIVKPRTGSGVKPQKDWVSTLYVNGGGDEVIAVYELTYEELIANQKVKDKLTLKDLYLHSESRLGTLTENSLLASEEYQITGYGSDGTFTGRSPMAGTQWTSTLSSLPFVQVLYKGKKQFELQNQVGSVNVTLTDRRISIDGNTDGVTDYYLPDIVTVNDYYAFGSTMPVTQTIVDVNEDFQGGTGSFVAGTGAITVTNPTGTQLHIQSAWTYRPLAKRTVTLVKDRTYTLNLDLTGFSTASGFSHTVRVKIYLSGTTLTYNYSATGPQSITFTSNVSGYVDIEISSQITGSGTYPTNPYIDIDNFKLSYVSCSMASGYRYGFNAEDYENNLGTEGSVYDLGARFYDSRLGRMFSVDPLAAEYPWQSVYAYHRNSPVLLIDWNGYGDPPYCPLITKFEYNGTWVDIPSAISNAGINIVNIVPTLWNSGVYSVDNIRKGIYLETLKNEVVQLSKDIKNEAVYNYRWITKDPYGYFKTGVQQTFSAQGLEFMATVYLGGRMVGKVSVPNVVKNSTTTAKNSVKASVKTTPKGSPKSTPKPTPRPKAQSVAAKGVGSKLPTQIHHFATNKHSVWTSKMEGIAKQFGLDLNGAWNKAAMPHLGRHPNAYHQFVYEGMQKAAAGAGGNQAKFLQLFDQYVKQPVLQNPNLLRKSGW